jgi:hypothetical protein
MLKNKLAQAKDAKTRGQLIEKIKWINPGYVPPD